MNSLNALKELTRLRLPVITTGDAAGALATTHRNASKMLERLGGSEQAFQISRKFWTLDEKLDPLVLPDYLSAPWPSYISLQSALFIHGMLSQIPAAVTAVSLARTKTYSTRFGKIEIHHLDRELFGVYELAGKYSIKLAVPEKALIDLLYLKVAPRGRKGRLPEIEIDPSFSRKKALSFIAKISSLARRKQTERMFYELLDQGVET